MLYFQEQFLNAFPYSQDTETIWVKVFLMQAYPWKVVKVKLTLTILNQLLFNVRDEGKEAIVQQS